MAPIKGKSVYLFGTCKCCLQNGCFKNLWSEYCWMGEREIYGAMLSECFALSSFDKGDGGKDMICEACVTRLRDAYNFKKQVLNSELILYKAKTELESLSPRTDLFDIIKIDDLPSGSIGEEELTPAARGGGEGAGGGRGAGGVEGAGSREARPYRQYSEDALQRCLEDVRSGAMTREAASVYYKVPKRTIGFKIGNHRKASATSKQTCIQGDHQQFLEEIKTFLHHTNATPFKTCNTKLHCAFCSHEFDDAEVLRSHTATEHCEERTKGIDAVMTPHWLNETLKVDIENLQCNICQTGIAQWKEVFTHFDERHEIKFNVSRSKMIPFHLQPPYALNCVICQKGFPNFGSLDGHMNEHFKNYICQTCGDPYLSYNRYIKHTAKHNVGEYKCHMCDKVFSLDKYRRKHIENIHYREKKIKCRFCDKMFSAYYQRHSHVLEQHKEKIKVITCEMCGKSFDWKPYYLAHVRKDHLNERNYKCEHCTCSFFMSCELKRHLITHTGIKEHGCACGKRFGTKWLLKKHSRTHRDTKKAVPQKQGRNQIIAKSYK